MDRQALVRRHNPRLRRPDALSPLTVGNGRFAFTADVTGLQTFAAEYRAAPLCTLSQWGWHTTPPAPELAGARLVPEPFDAGGRSVGYPTSASGQEALYRHLRENPHRLHLGRLGLRWRAGPLRLDDLAACDQTLDLWTGTLISAFELYGVPVRVRTVAHPELDLLAVRCDSPLLADGRLALLLAFPYGSPDMAAADWANPERHATAVVQRGRDGALLRRAVDQTRYHLAAAWSPGAILERPRPHHYVLRAAPGATHIECTCRFTRGAVDPGGLPPVAATAAAAARHWSRFWRGGGACDLSASSDPRAPELERRVVLSQYLTAIQCAGGLPPQETGLTCNSWYGKFHLEMHWWHAAHFALWGRAPLLERSLSWYRRILPAARATAGAQGYAGARWPKMTGPDGRESPSPVGPLLIWQQPHPILLADLCRRARPGPRTLRRYRDIVFASADFMASYPRRDPATGSRHLGPPVIPAQECHPPRATADPTFELAYWRHGLEIAQGWRLRLGLPRERTWDRAVAALAPLPAAGGVYLAHARCPQTFAERNRDHPSMLAALGMLPGEGVDREIMRRTLERVRRTWRWETTWGWDYPLMAMTAARLGEPALAVDLLLMDTPKNRYLQNGHCRQRDSLPVYLPANGGLLAAVAMMAAGWEGAPSGDAPGFPADGTWVVRREGLRPWL